MVSPRFGGDVLVLATRNNWPDDPPLCRGLDCGASRNDEAGQSELRLLFQSANVVHANFYENWLSERMVRDGMGDVRQLLGILDPVV